MLSSKHWLGQPEETRVAEMLPMVALLEDNETTLTEGNECVRVIQLQGRDYSGMPRDIQNAAFITRKQMFEQAEPSIGIATHSLRHKMGAAIKTGHHGNTLIDKMAETWGNHLNEEIYRTFHYIVLYTKPAGFLDSIFTPKAEDAGSVESKLKSLDDITKAVMVRLNEFNPWILEGDAHISFWATLVNGKPSNVKMDGNPYFTDDIAYSTLYWPSDKMHLQEYDEGRKKRYSTWFAISRYPSMSVSSMFEALFRFPIALSLHQVFSPIRDEEAKKEAKSRKKLIQAEHAEDSVSFAEQAFELNTALTNKEKTCSVHSWALQVFADSEKELNGYIKTIESATDPFGIKLVRESTNSEALFWSIYPTKENYIPNCRKRAITSENASHACTFANTNEGLSSCSWGDEPITILKTETGADYSLTFQANPRPQALGNALIFGGSEAGKTTFFQFIDHMCRKYKGHKSLIFDNQRGMKIPAKMTGADYEEFKEGSILNPLQLDDTLPNRAFLTSFFQIASGKYDETSLERITQAIEQNYKMPFENRRLTDLDLAFGPKAADSFAQAMQKWLPGGAYGHIFNAEEDSLKFKNNRVYFDCTMFQSLPEAFSLFAYYVFYAFRRYTSDQPCPHTIFIDELKRFLLNPVFAKELLSAFQQIRKSEGVIIAAIQEVGALLESEVGEHLIKSTASLFFFTDTTAKREEYVDGLGLTEEEFDWVKTPNIRQVLLKRPKTGESTILNLDLSPLGNKLLGTINSSTAEVDRMEKIIEQHGREWRQVFWNSL